MHACALVFHFFRKQKEGKEKGVIRQKSWKQGEGLMKAETHFPSNMDIFLLLFTLNSACTPYRIISEADFSILYLFLLGFLPDNSANNTHLSTLSASPCWAPRNVQTQLNLP